MTKLQGDGSAGPWKRENVTMLSRQFRVFCLGRYHWRDLSATAAYTPLPAYGVLFRIA